MDSVKQEKRYFPDLGEANNGTFNVSPIDISSSSCSSSSSSSDDSDSENSFFVNIRSELNKKRGLNEFDNGYLLPKKPKLESCDFNIALSPNSLSFLPPPFPLSFVAPKDVTETEPALEGIPAAMDANVNINTQATPVFRTCKQFWKAGDYEGGNADESSSKSVGMAHVRVHPKFLHSNATSHKWALGAFAELLDNSLDEVCYGATYVNVDMIKNKKDGANMLLVEDNGGGMTPDKMRQCMSLGYSAKSKMANTIGQYGNGFKTSTMRLGADVIVFSRCQGNNGNSPTQSIGMLSYSFLMGTGKQDIIVPMIDYEERGESWNKMLRSSLDDWNRNLETIIQWSPYTSEEDLIQQFNFLEDQGTRIIIYNLWEDDEGNLELDFDSDSHDIQIRGVNRDEKNIEMARKYPNSRHFLTYRHSLRSYASILYLRLPSSFKIILRGKDVQHHNIVNDMMLTKEITYKPLHLPEKLPQDLNMVATVTIGFVKDARHHIDIQGFNVYHKNRLIKPFWRVWNAAGSDGRGAIGVLEANFVEPAHDKQGFERTPVLSRLEARLVAIQKKYWCTNCQEVGYAARRPYSKTNIRVSAKTDAIASDTGTSASPSHPGSAKTGSRTSDKEKSTSRLKQNDRDCTRSKTKLVMDCCQKSPGVDGASEDGSNHTAAPASGQSQPDSLVQGTNLEIPRKPRSKAAAINGVGQDLSNGDTEILIRKEANQESGERFKRKERPTIDVVQRDLQQEKDKCKFLENELKETQKQLQKAQEKIEEMDLEQIALIDMIQEERMRRDEEEQRLRNKLRVALDEIDEQLEKLKQLEKTGNNSKLNIEE